MDYIFIKGLQVPTVIGVFDWEKEITQTLVIDLKLFRNLSIQASDDCLEKGVDYAQVSQDTVDFGKHNSFELIETFAERLCAELLTSYPIQSIECTLHKNVDIAGQPNDVGIHIIRSKN